MTAIGAALSGMNAASRQLDQVAEKVSRLADPNTMDAADISQEAVQLLTARTAFETAVKVAKIADDIQKGTLDLLG